MKTKTTNTIRKILGTLSFLSLLGILGCSHMGQKNEIESIVLGLREMIQDIEHNAERAKHLNRRFYNLSVKLEGDWDLSLQPQEAFRIKKMGAGKFLVTITDGPRLFEKSTGLLKRKNIQAQIYKMGEAKGKIDLTADLECMFLVSFYQANGERVNFEDMRKGYKYEFQVSHPESIRIRDRGKDYINVVRQQGSTLSASVGLKLINKSTKEIYFTPKVFIPACLHEPISKKTVMMPRTPGQCITHVKEGPKVFKDRTPWIQAKETFHNHCDVTISCLVKAKYGLAHKGKLVFVETKDSPLTIAARSSNTLDLSWENKKFEGYFDSKVFTVSRFDRTSVGPKDTDPHQEFLECHWGEKLEKFANPSSP